MSRLILPALPFRPLAPRGAQFFPRGVGADGAFEIPPFQEERMGRRVDEPMDIFLPAAGTAWNGLDRLGDGFEERDAPLALAGEDTPQMGGMHPQALRYGPYGNPPPLKAFADAGCGQRHGEAVPFPG